MVEDVSGSANEANYLRAKINGDEEVIILNNQSAIATISAANCLVYLPEKNEKISKGDSAEVILLLEDLI